MSEEVKLEVIKMTQESLGKYIKKPPLTEKLLKKPPFRFLHDIVTNTIRETGFLSGLYSETEMNSDNIKDREHKIAFLETLIDCLKIVTEKNVTARPSKIVAGLEPTKTNEMLQLIGLGLNKKLDSSTAVAQIKGNNKNINKKDNKTKLKKSPSSNITPAGGKKTEVVKKEEKKVKASPRTKQQSKENVTKERTESKTTKKVKKNVIITQKEKIDKPKEIEIETETPEPQTETIEETKQPESLIEINKLEIVKVEHVQQEHPKIPETKKPEIIIKPETKKPEIIIKPETKKPEIIIKPETKEPDIIIKSGKTEKPEEIRIKTAKRPKKQIVALSPQELPPEMQSKEPFKTEIFRPKSSLRPPSVRPSSARPGAPRFKDKNEIIIPQDQLVPMGKVNVIVENYSTNIEADEDNEETVVVESISDIQDPIPKVEIEIPAEQGHLVAQILEQINDEGNIQETKKTIEIEWDDGGKRNRETASKEMEKLRESIQTLTRAANPLGKLMNFLQEDIDSMRSELKIWMELNETLTTEIKSLEKINEEAIEPLKKQLNRLDNDILKQHEQIYVTKGNILRNEEKIKMILNRDG